MNKLKLLTIICLLFLLKTTNSYSLIEVDITRGNLNPLPVAVSPLFQDKKSKIEFQRELNLDDIGSEISKVVENNLKQSGLFNPLSKDAFLQKPDIAHLKPRFEGWTFIKAQA
jgi:TolB protein